MVSSSVSAAATASSAASAEMSASGGGDAEGACVFEGVSVTEAAVDAMWFKRPSQGGREAWELRLAGEPPYALFELFEPDEEEDDREDVRREMEARLREYAAPSGEARD